MEFIKPDVNINFIGKRKIGYIISMVMIAITLISLIAHKGPRYGIDFAGGTLVQVRFDKNVDINNIRSGLEEVGLGNSSVQLFGEVEQNEYMIHTKLSTTSTEGLSENIENALEDSTAANAQIRRVEMVGPQVGKDLRRKALFALFYALLFITIYISGRFEMKWLLSAVIAAALIGAVLLLSQFKVSIPILIAVALIVSIILFWFLELKYAMGAIVALLHDVTITVGLFSLFDKEFTLPIIAALLTIIGYSLNDTIIVFDRIRENLRKNYRDALDVNINRSINETLSRTLLTSGTTLVVVISLFVLGGEIIHDFAFAMIIGVLIGTYSSIYVASPILLAWQSKATVKK